MVFRQILVCATPGKDACGETRCGEKGGDELLALFREEVRRRGLDAAVVAQNSCSRRHHEGPVVFVFPDDEWYTEVTAKDIPEIVERHFASSGAEQTSGRKV